MPRSLAVIGAGVIGIEYATIFSALDVAVTLIEPRDTFLDFVDREIIAEFTHQLRDRGMAIRLGSKVVAIEKDKTGRVVTTLEDGRAIRTEMLLFAAGGWAPPAAWAWKIAASRSTIAGGSPSFPRPFRPTCRISMPRATSSAFRAWPRPRMEQGRIAACHAFDLPMPRAPGLFPLWHLCRAGNLDRGQ